MVGFETHIHEYILKKEEQKKKYFFFTLIIFRWTHASIKINYFL
jgi:hypothetical protein